MSTDYKRGYGKGYYRGQRLGDARAALERDKAYRSASRAEMREKEIGIIHCEECLHWERGCGTCAWGYCNAPESAGTPWSTWVRNADGEGRIITSPRFGCVIGIIARGGAASPPGRGAQR